MNAMANIECEGCGETAEVELAPMAMYSTFALYQECLDDIKWVVSLAEEACYCPKCARRYKISRGFH